MPEMEPDQALNKHSLFTITLSIILAVNSFLPTESTQALTPQSVNIETIPKKPSGNSTFHIIKFLIENKVCFATVAHGFVRNSLPPTAQILINKQSDQAIFTTDFQNPINCKKMFLGSDISPDLKTVEQTILKNLNQNFLALDRQNQTIYIKLQYTGLIDNGQFVFIAQNDLGEGVSGAPLLSGNNRDIMGIQARSHIFFSRKIFGDMINLILNNDHKYKLKYHSSINADPKLHTSIVSTAKQLRSQGLEEPEIANQVMAQTLKLLIKPDSSDLLYASIFNNSVVLKDFVAGKLSVIHVSPFTKESVSETK